MIFPQEVFILPSSTHASVPAGAGRDLSLDFLKGISMLMVVFFP